MLERMMFESYDCVYQLQFLRPRSEYDWRKHRRLIFATIAFFYQSEFCGDENRYDIRLGQLSPHITVRTGSAFRICAPLFSDFLKMKFEKGEVNRFGIRMNGFLPLPVARRGQFPDCSLSFRHTSALSVADRADDVRTSPFATDRISSRKRGKLV